MKYLIEEMERTKGASQSARTLLGLPPAAEAPSWGGGRGRWSLPPEEELKKVVDPGGKGFRECAYGSGFETCTEGLGCESCDGGVMATEYLAGWEMGALSTAAAGEEEEEEDVKLRLRPTSAREGRERMAFPPPLPRRRGWMRAERRDGRLILTEVRIERLEVFCARREGGRLRLHLIEYEGAGEAKGEEEEGEGGEEERAGRRRGEGIWQCQEVASGAATRSPSMWDNRFLMAA